MENLAVAFTGIGIVLVMIHLLAGIVELASARTIRATAEEYSRESRHGRQTPGFLKARLRGWERNLPKHSLGMSKNVDALKIKDQLDSAADAKGTWQCVSASPAVYKTASIEFPIRFGWPLLGLLFLLLGATLYGFASPDVLASGWWDLVKLIALIGALAIVSLALTLPYCIVTGNSARPRDRMYRAETRKAWTALGRAQRSKASGKNEDAAIKRLLERSR